MPDSRPAVVVVLLMLVAVQVHSMWQESQTWDEAIELASGYSFLKTGEFRMQLEHPPLGKILNAVPLLILRPDLPVNDESWPKRDELMFGAMFLYSNRIGPETLLMTGRAVTVGVTLGLALAIALWTRASFGARAAWIALLLFCLDPNVIANGRYVKNDMLVTLLGFLTFIAWRKQRPWLAGVIFGLALATKFSAVFLLPVLGILWRSPRALGAVLLAGGLTALAVYGPENRALIPITRTERLVQPETRLLRLTVDRSTIVGRAFAWAGARLGWRAHPLLIGLAQFAAHARGGHPAYLLGMHSQTGWWHYFPVAFAVKTPVATLVALAVAFLLAAGAPKQTPWILLVPVAVYALFCLTSRINIGVRHLLPLYPFLYIFAAVNLARLRVIYLALLTLPLAAESLSVHPHYLAFFNIVAGGPAAGPRYLADSNIDWGQDAKKLKVYMDAHHVPEVCLTYFGTADLSTYGVRHRQLREEDVPRVREICDVVAISVTPLVGVYVANDAFAWLRRIEPDARIGYSIYVYNLKPRAP